MHILRLVSAAKGLKPETIVLGECVGLRQRRLDELVHLRGDESNPRCVVCMQTTGPNYPWFGDREKWQAHGWRCV